MIARLQACYKEIYPHTTPINFIQVGVGAGQTVAHHHTHVIAPGEEDTAEYMYHLWKESSICGSNAEWITRFDQPSQALVALYNSGKAINFIASS